MIAYIGYTRCSTIEQQKATSHDYQRSGIERSYKVSEMECLGWFSDTSSGRKVATNEGLEKAYRFLKQIAKKSKYKKLYLIVYKTDRFGRDVEGCFGAIRKFREIGIEVNFSEEWIDYSDANWSMILSVRFGLAHSESDRIGARTKDAYRQILSNGMFPFRVPLGYKKENNRVVKDDVISSAIRNIFDDYLSGAYSKADLFERYNGQLNTSKNTFLRIFENKFYAGIIYNKYNNKEEIGLHDSYISVDEYETIQQIASGNAMTLGKAWQNGTAQNDFFFLKGALICANTKKAMTAYYTTKKNGRKFAYYQTAKIVGNEKRQIVNAEKAHCSVTEFMRSFEVSKEVQNEVRKEIFKMFEEADGENQRKAKRLNNELQQGEARLKRLKLSFMDGELSANDFSELKQDIEKGINTVASELSKIEAIDKAELKAQIDIILRVGVEFGNYSAETKTEILKIAFPKGFWLDENLAVRTDFLDPIFSLTNSLSNNYKQKTDLTFDVKPEMGHKWGNVRTKI